MKPLSPDSEKEYELIRRYFDFELNEEELAEVDERMETDAVFMERLRLFQVSDEQLLQLASSVSSGQTAKTITLKPKSNSLTITTWRAIAAGLVLLIGCAFAFWLFSNQNLSPSELAQNYWEQTETITFSNLRSTDETDNVQKQLVTASTQFRANNFAASLATLNTIPADANDYHKAALLKGEIYFEQNNFEDAVQQFQVVIDHPNNEYNDYAYWYQTLAYLQLEDVATAKGNLELMREQRYLMSLVEGLMEEMK